MEQTLKDKTRYASDVNDEFMLVVLSYAYMCLNNIQLALLCVAVYNVMIPMDCVYLIVCVCDYLNQFKM